MVDDKQLACFNMITSSSSDSARCTIKSRTFERFNLTPLIIDVSYIDSITKGLILFWDSICHLIRNNYKAACDVVIFKINILCGVYLYS